MNRLQSLGKSLSNTQDFTKANINQLVLTSENISSENTVNVVAIMKFKPGALESARP